MCSVMQNERKLLNLLTKKQDTTICNLGMILEVDGEEVIMHPCEKEGLQECSIQKYQQCYMWYKEKWGTYE